MPQHATANVATAVANGDNVVCDFVSFACRQARGQEGGVLQAYACSAAADTAAHTIMYVAGLRAAALTKYGGRLSCIVYCRVLLLVGRIQPLPCFAHEWGG